MCKKIIKIAFTLILIIIVTMFISNSVFATDNFDFEGFDNNSNTDVDNVTQNFMGTAIQVIRVVGTGVAIIMLTYLGIKYMMAAPSEKADFKKSMSIYILGAILMIAATNILGIIASFTNSNITS